MVHICNWVNIVSDNGLSPILHQAIAWTNAGLFSIGHSGTNSHEIFIKILNFSFTKINLKISSVKSLLFCPGSNVLRTWMNKPSEYVMDWNMPEINKKTWHTSGAMLHLCMFRLDIYCTHWIHICHNPAYKQYLRENPVWCYINLCQWTVPERLDLGQTVICQRQEGGGLGPALLTWVRIWISNYIHCFILDVISRSCLNSNGHLTKLPLKLV